MNHHKIQLTWPGFDAAIDLIAAQCKRKCSGVYGPTSAGTMLAIALATRLNIAHLDKGQDGMLLVEGWGCDGQIADYAERFDDVEIWVWIDTTPNYYNAVCRMETVNCVAMPWQDAALDCSQPFIPTFHD